MLPTWSITSPTRAANHAPGSPLMPRVRYTSGMGDVCTQSGAPPPPGPACLYGLMSISVVVCP